MWTYVWKIKGLQWGLISLNQHTIKYTFRATRESHNYYLKRRLKRLIVIFSGRFSFFPRSFLLFFATKLREPATRVRRDDEFDTFARSFDDNCRLETKDLSEKGGAPDKRRIIAPRLTSYIDECDLANFCDRIGFNHKPGTLLLQVFNANWRVKYKSWWNSERKIYPSEFTHKTHIDIRI